MSFRHGNPVCRTTANNLFVFEIHYDENSSRTGIYDRSAHSRLAVDEFVVFVSKSTRSPYWANDRKTCVISRSVRIPVYCQLLRAAWRCASRWYLEVARSAVWSAGRGYIRSLAEMEITMEGAEGSVLEGKVWLAADCVSAQAIRRVTGTLNRALRLRRLDLGSSLKSARAISNEMPFNTCTGASPSM